MMRLPDIIGVKLTGKRQPGITATDIVLAITEFLRKRTGGRCLAGILRRRCEKLHHRRPCDHFQHDPGIRRVCGMFYIDEQTIDYLKLTGREPEQVTLVENYAKTTGLWADALVRRQIPACTGIRPV